MNTQSVFLLHYKLIIVRQMWNVDNFLWWKSLNQLFWYTEKRDKKHYLTYYVYDIHLILYGKFRIHTRKYYSRVCYAQILYIWISKYDVFTYIMRIVCISFCNDADFVKLYTNFIFVYKMCMKYTLTFFESQIFIYVIHIVYTWFLQTVHFYVLWCLIALYLCVHAHFFDFGL